MRHAALLANRLLLRRHLRGLDGDRALDPPQAHRLLEEAIESLGAKAGPRTNERWLTSEL